jgi:hypothetical protein
MITLYHQTHKANILTLLTTRFKSGSKAKFIKGLYGTADIETHSHSHKKGNYGGVIVEIRIPDGNFITFGRENNIIEQLSQITDMTKYPDLGRMLDRQRKPHDRAIWFSAYAKEHKDILDNIDGLIIEEVYGKIIICADKNVKDAEPTRVSFDYGESWINKNDVLTQGVVLEARDIIRDIIENL